VVANVGGATAETTSSSLVVPNAPTVTSALLPYSHQAPQDLLERSLGISNNVFDGSVVLNVTMVNK